MSDVVVYGVRLDDLVTLLGDRAFFFDERPSIADLAVHAQLELARSGPTPQAAAAIERRPALVEWMKRVET